MGRNVIYDYFASYGGFDLANLGQGLGFCELELERIEGSNALGYMSSVRSLHNDLLRLTVEAGTVVSIVWLALKCFAIPLVLEKRFGVQTVLYYSLLLLYAFIVYMTDNTMSYIVFQATLFVMLACMILQVQQDTNSIEPTCPKHLKGRSISNGR